MRGLASGVSVDVASIADAYEYKWTRDMDETLVCYIDDIAAKTGRRLMSLTFRDIMPLQQQELENPLYAAIRNVSIEHIRAR